MTRLRAIGLALGLGLVFAPSAHAIVGGTAVPEGKRNYVAYITIDGLFACTGTLVSPTVVVTAGHCSSITGVAAATPIGKLGLEIEVSLGSIRPGAGEKPAVSKVIVHPDYSFANLLLSDRETDVSNDVALLKLATPSAQTPVPLAAVDERESWRPGALAQIAGFGTTSSGGDAPDVMQETEVPIVTDEKAAATYSSFEPGTQIGAGFPEGGKDTCQGDSGGPLLVPATGGALRLIGDTSYGSGCADPDTPGIYGRLADAKLRQFVAQNAPDGIAPERSALTMSVARSTLAGALRSGLRVRLRCGQCSSVTTAKVSRATARRLGLRSRTVARGGQTGDRAARLRFTRTARRALEGAARVGVTLRVVTTTAAGQRSVDVQRITLR